MTVRALILSDDDGMDLKRWGLAAAIVLATHVALMASYLVFAASEPEGAAVAPAVIVDLSPVPVAPSSPLDLAPGPEMTEAQPTPTPPPEAKPEVVEPVQKIEAPAEVTLPLPEPKATEKQPKESPHTTPSETKPVDRNTPAPRTTAAPRSEQRTAATPQAPSPGSAASRAAMANWRDLVVARLQQAKRYPADAQSRREQGVATLSFSVDRNGRVLSRSIVRGSGSAALDQEVLAMIQRAQPLPSFPPAMTQAAIQLIVPIRFSLR